MADVEVRQTNGDGGTNWLLVIVVLVLVLLIAWFFFAGRDEPASEVDVEVPAAEAPEIEVPEQIDVNVEGGDAGGDVP